MKISVQPVLCHLCQEHEESIQHLLSGCPALVSISYLHQDTNDQQECMTAQTVTIQFSLTHIAHSKCF